MTNLPDHLKGPFVSGYYDRKQSSIYFKRQNGKYVSTKCLPSFFIDAKNKKRFPWDDYSDLLEGSRDEDKYLRVFLNPNADYRKVRDMIEDVQTTNVVKIYEGDVQPVRRWISDYGPSISMTYRSLFFDIETHMLVKGFDDEAKKQHVVISFSAKDTQGNSWHESVKEPTDEEEVELLKKLFAIFDQYDVILAWNGENYDFFVLKERAKYHDLRVRWSSYNRLDYMRVVKKLLASIPDPQMKKSFKLDIVGETVLGMRKLKLSVGYDEMYKIAGTDELREYNDRDVDIMIGVDKKRDFLALHYALCSICYTFPGRSSTFPNELADGILLRLGVEHGVHFPSRSNTKLEDEVRYEGAFVFDPKIGFHQSIQVPDFASLYPSIIMSWNMSNETVIKDGERIEPGTPIATATATGVRFRTDVQGLIPMALKQLIAKRKEYNAKAKQFGVDSEEYKNTMHLSTAVKVAANSFYGLIGSPSSRFSDINIARSVTLSAQLLIREVAKYFERRGMEIVAGDTDSVFVKTTRERMKESLEEVNSVVIPNLLSSSGCRECAVRMEYDKGYKTLLIVVKKHYAGKLDLWKGREAPPDMKPEVKGLEVQRGDQVKYGQRLQWKYIDMLLEPDADPVLVERELKHDSEKFFDSGTKIELEDIEVYEGLSKGIDEYKSETTGVKLAKQMIQSGQEFFVGMKIPCVIVGHRPTVQAILASDFKGKFDRVYYWENKILPMIERLLVVRFQGYNFRDFTQPNQFQLNFFGGETTTEYKVTKKIVKKTVKKSIASILPGASPNSTRTCTVTFKIGTPDDYIIGTRKLAKAFVGDIALTIEIQTLNETIAIDTKTKVSTEFKDAFSEAFPNVEIKIEG